MRKTINVIILVTLSLLLIMQLESCTKKEKLKIKVESINLSEEKGELYIDNQIQLIATILPKNASPINLKWESDKTEIARVDETGEVTALSEGTAIITVKSDNTDKTDSFTLTVKKKIIKVNSIKIIRSVKLITNKDTIIEGEDIYLSVKILPKNSENKSVKWTTSDKNIVTIDQNGKIHAEKAGKSTIKVSTEDGEKTAELKLNVKAKKIEVKQIIINSSSKQVLEGGELQLTATVLPENSTDKAFIWSTDNREIATIDQNGKLNAIKEGTVKIKAIAVKNRIYSEYSITVTKMLLVSEIQIHSPKNKIIVGEELQLTGTVIPADANNKEFTWDVDNKNIASIDKDGKLIAKTKGSVKVIAKAADKNGIIAEYNILIIVPVNEIKIDNAINEIYVGKNLSLNASILPENASNKSIVWSSSDENIATVNQNGQITAIKEGNVIIKAASEERNDIYKECNFTIKVKDVTEITIEKPANVKNIYIKDEISFKATVSPEDATYKDITWTISDDNIATISQEGILFALKKGTVTITATSECGKIFCNSIVEIKEPEVSIEGISIVKDEYKLDIRNIKTIRADIFPKNATHRTITWTSSHPEIASISQRGRVVAIKGGTTTITATAGGYTARCQVIVRIPLENISFQEETYELMVKESLEINPIYTPQDATNKNIVWSSSSDNIATVNQHGQITAIKEGEAKITATSEDGAKIAECKFIIKADNTYKRVESVSYNTENLYITIGNSKNVDARFTPENATDKEIKYESSNTEIASVDKDGNVLALMEGKVTISATPHETRTTKEIEFIITRLEFGDWLLFKRLLNQTSIDKDNNCVFSEKEINQTDTIKLIGFGLSSLKGIEQFQNIEILDCSNNNLIELDLSKCAYLKELNCSQTKSIGKIYLHPDVYERAKNKDKFIKNDEDNWAIKE